MACSEWPDAIALIVVIVAIFAPLALLVVKS